MAVGASRLGAARRSAHEWAHELHHQRTDHARPTGRAALAWRLRAKEHGGRRERGAMPLAIAHSSGRAPIVVGADLIPRVMFAKFLVGQRWRVATAAGLSVYD
jgi:hypothetical protein